jgi:hypothetical protein
MMVLMPLPAAANDNVVWIHDHESIALIATDQGAAAAGADDPVADAALATEGSAWCRSGHAVGGVRTKRHRVTQIIARQIEV